MKAVELWHNCCHPVNNNLLHTFFEPNACQSASRLNSLLHRSVVSGLPKVDLMSYIDKSFNV